MVRILLLYFQSRLASDSVLCLRSMVLGLGRRGRH